MEGEVSIVHITIMREIYQHRFELYKKSPKKDMKDETL
ncbi:hypothetical protein bcere0022_19900 [Bacillus cereus Rock3-44]|nr:hypothetical protein bcere0022_19900 [Bacillus cereus Rock3-44]